MLNLLRKFLQPTLRQQLEEGVRDALRRYADRRSAPDLRVYVSMDLVPEGTEPGLWARDEADHLRRFAAQWAEDNGISRAGLRVETVLLDTKREFAFVKPLGLEPPKPSAPTPRATERMVLPGAGAPDGRDAGRGGGSGGALLEVVSSDALREPVRVSGETIVGRRAGDGVTGLGDRYMSARHARLRVNGGRLLVTDLDSKNRTFVNDQAIPPHHEHTLTTGDMLRMGNTVLRVGQVR